MCGWVGGGGGVERWWRGVGGRRAKKRLRKSADNEMVIKFDFLQLSDAKRFRQAQNN